MGTVQRSSTSLLKSILLIQSMSAKTGTKRGNALSGCIATQTLAKSKAWNANGQPLVLAMCLYHASQLIARTSIQQPEAYSVLKEATTWHA